MINKLNGTLARSVQSNDILKEMRYDILLRRYPPNSQITEQAICEKYKISRSPVRAIMQQLEREGMLVMLENGCKKVVGFTRQDLCDLYELRNFLEISSIKSIFRSETRNYTPLIRMLDHIEQNKNAGAEEIIEADVNFHRSVILMSNNKYNLSAYNNIMPTLYTIFLVSIRTYTEEFFDKFDNRHELLVRSILNGDEAECIKNFNEHHENALNKAFIMIDAIDNGDIK